MYPDRVEAHNNLGLALLEAGEKKGAEAEFRQALRLQPKSAEAHYNLGLVLAKEGEVRAAAEEVRLAHELDATRTPP